MACSLGCLPVVLGRAVFALVVVSLEARRLADLTDQLPLDLRPPPSVAAYDSLLTGTRDP